LLNAISKPAEHTDDGMQENRYQVGGVVDRHNHNHGHGHTHGHGDIRPEDVLHEEDVFLRYDPEDVPHSQHAQQQDGPVRREEMMMERIASNEEGEGEQTGNSIQGLLAASRMISGDEGRQDDVALNQVSATFSLFLGFELNESSHRFRFAARPDMKPANPKPLVNPLRRPLSDHDGSIRTR
jgi:hypothetical protein